ncbi:hypothetical protein RJ639_029540 [Escallonia herrerae]|uniref:Alpha/beta hydrolase fold-3 domain-containing protein n=1 Tax=Escallonia herrerae TaxID=1293975 RepID=A0AA88RTW0_9ASTE|nr:hypothetical protein RJ639_029540 [Escallonia herrerae]
MTQGLTQWRRVRRAWWGLGCSRVLVSVAEKDLLRDRGRMYYEALGRSGWMGVAEIHETEGADHGFHLYNLDSEKAKDLIRRQARDVLTERRAFPLPIAKGKGMPME